MASTSPDQAPSEAAPDNDDVEKLKAALSANKSLIEQLATANALIEARLVQRAGRPFRLLDLPRELRDIIYKLCVAPGTVFLPPFRSNDTRYYDRKTTEKPQWQLFATNHQIRQEAMEAFFSDNTLVVSSARCRMLFDSSLSFEIGRQASPIPAPALSRMVLQHLASVSFSFDLRGVVDKPLAVVKHTRFKARNAAGPPLSTDDQRLSAYHAHAMEHYRHWEDLIQLATESPKLRRVQVDLTYCYCPLGCHRMIGSAGMALEILSYEDTPLREIEVLGTMTDRERNHLTKTLVHGFFFEYTAGQTVIENDKAYSNPKEITLKFKEFDSKDHRAMGGVEVVGEKIRLESEEFDLRGKIHEYESASRSESDDSAWHS